MKQTKNNNPYLVSVAPMMDYTDRHGRYFLRLCSSKVRLYTEMITSQAILHGDRDHLLSFRAEEHPLALQVGGSQPHQLAECARLAQSYGFDEINLNVGCPSSRVRAGEFGACLMQNPHLVAECVRAMQQNTSLPVTIKCRIGVDQQDSYMELCHFVEKVAKAGCRVFFIHARKAWLSGLSPKENRTVPPLRYEIVHQIKRDFPELTIVINGGITTLTEVETQLGAVDGVMIGRAAFNHPYFLTEIAQHYFQESPKDRIGIITRLLPYVHAALQNGVKLTAITRHIYGLFHGQPNAAAWRRYLSNEAYKRGAGVEVIENALALAI